MKLELKAGDEIYRTDGTPSGFIFVEPVEMRSHNLYAKVVCPVCKQIQEINMGNIRTGGQLFCGECKQVRLSPGDRLTKKSGEPTRLVYLRDLPKRNGNRHIRALCDCGREYDIRLSKVRSGTCASCPSCARKARRVVHVGERYGRLVVRAYIGKRKNRLRYSCRCDCGAIVAVNGCDLASGNTASCGCLLEERRGKENRVNWCLDDVVGPFVIRQAFYNPGELSRFEVFDTRDQTVKVLRQCDIRIAADPMLDFTARIRGRLRKLIETKDFKFMRKFYSQLTFTEADVDEFLPPCPGANYHLDHICPLRCAKTEEEAIALCHPKNLQWLTPSENASKKASWTEEGARLHKELLGREWLNE